MIGSSFLRLNFQRTLKITQIAFSSGNSRKCYYDVLKVPIDASNEMIRKQFAKLAKEFHPDVIKDNKDKQIFQMIAEAYGVLSNEELRQEYDSTMGYHRQYKKYDQDDTPYDDEWNEPLKRQRVDTAKEQAYVDELNEYFNNKYYNNRDASVKDPANPLNFDMSLFEAKEVNNAKGNEEHVLYKPGTLYEYWENKEEVEKAPNPYIAGLKDAKYLALTLGLLAGYLGFIDPHNTNDKNTIVTNDN